jgi:hypothetical protein
VFTYGTPHTVDELSAADYTACSFAAPLSSDAGGSTTVVFDKPGTRYFACSSGSHCSMGQKVAITVSNSTAPPSSSKGGSSSYGAAAGGGAELASKLVVGLAVGAGAILAL